ncbi:MAG: hypothetical protein AAGN35_26125 [Bacteroidota bacterium]
MVAKFPFGMSESEWNEMRKLGAVISPDNWSSPTTVESSKSSDHEQIFDHVQAVLKAATELGFATQKILSLCYNILQEAYRQGKSDLHIDTSAENEIMIFRIINGQYSRILIDEAGDVSYIFIAKRLEDARSKTFMFQEEWDFSEIVNEL